MGIEIITEQMLENILVQEAPARGYLMFMRDAYSQGPLLDYDCPLGLVAIPGSDLTADPDLTHADILVFEFLRKHHDFCRAIAYNKKQGMSVVQLEMPSEHAQAMVFQLGTYAYKTEFNIDTFLIADHANAAKLVLMDSPLGISIEEYAKIEPVPDEFLKVSQSAEYRRYQHLYDDFMQGRTPSTA